MGIYDNELRRLVTQPGSFRGTPGYQFAFDQGQEAVNRKMGGMRGSGNALAALMQHGQGLASQEYGNTVDRLGRFAGQEGQLELGREAGALARDRLGLDRELGTGQLGLARDRLGLDTELGRGRLAQDGVNSDRDFGLGMFRASNDFELGSRNADIAGQRSAWDYDLGRERNSIARADSENQFNLGQRAGDTAWYNARTQRGAAQSGAYNDSRRNDLEWLKYNPMDRYSSQFQRY